MDHLFLFGLIATWCAIAAGGWLGWNVLRQNGRILLRLETLEKRREESGDGEGDEALSVPMGSPAPDFELPDLAGKRRTLAEFLGRPLVLIFFNPTCGYCRDLAPRLVSLAAVGTAAAPRILLASTGEPEQNRLFFAEQKLDCAILLQKEMEVAMVYKASGTPSGYLIGPDGTVASELAVGAEALLELFHDESEKGKQKTEIETIAGNGAGREHRFRERSLANSKIKRDGLKAGTPAPDFRLPRLDETGELTLSDLRNRPTLLVFSSPHCGPCNELAPKLEKFHRKQPEVQVVMISRGGPEENRDKVKEHGLTFPVVLQKQWEISRQYAIFATPVAYLLDAAGVIVADVAVGVEPILGLMSSIGPLFRHNQSAAKPPFLKRLARLPVALTAALFERLLAAVTVAKSRIDTLELKHFKFVPRPDDIFIVTYPRSGTTWMQMILYQLTTDGSMGITHIAEHSPWFERSADSDRGYEERAGPRVFKSHLPYQNIPKGPGRYIYVSRDGRDVAFSYYHLYRSHNGYNGAFTDFFELFMSGKVMFGSWFDHVGGWWKHRHELNVLFLSYEELLADLEGCLRRIIAFCHLNVPEERLPLIIGRCGFPFMKQHEDKFDPAVEALWQQGARLNSFLRAGRLGEGLRHLSQEQQARFDRALQSQLRSAPFSRPDRAPPPRSVLSLSFGSR